MGKNKKSVLITGAAGFIGSNLTDELLNRGYEVYGIDNLSQGKLDNINEFFNNPNFKFFKLDVCDLKSLLRIKSSFSSIVHLAAYKIPRYGNAYDTLHINAVGTSNILEVAAKTKSLVVFASTSDVYGKNERLPFNETASSLVLGPTRIKRWAYAVSKIYGEHLCHAYREKYGVRFKILRYFGSYGPKEHLSWWSGPQSIFIESILDNKTVEIHGDGKQTRAFAYIEDTVRGTILAMEDNKSDNEVFNIGSNEEISIINLARLIGKLLNPKSKPNIKFIPYNRIHRNAEYEDVMRRVPDTLKSEKLLGFKAQVKLRDGLRRTIAWHKKIRKW